MKRPLLIAALFYMGGLILGEHVHVPLVWNFALAFTLALAALAFSSRRQILLMLLLIALGWLALAVDTAELSPFDLRAIFRDRIEYVTLRGTLCETPTIRVLERNNQPVLRTVAEIRVTEVRSNAEGRPACGRVAVSTSGSLGEEFFRGRAVEVTGVLASPKGPFAEGLFDYRTYLRRQGIYYQLRVDSPNGWGVAADLASPNARPLSDRFLRWAHVTLSRGLPVEDESLRLLWAMTLGWKTALTDAISEPFMQSGTLHVFAISGLHIALIAGIVVSVLRVLQVPRAACGLIVVPALWFYTGVTGWQSSAIRSTIMMTVIIAGWSLRRPADLVNSLAGAGLIILLWEPQQLFQASFQLSFCVVLSIALLVPPLEKLRQKLLRIDPFLPAELRPRWQRWLDVPVHYVTASLATSLAAWLGSLPLIAYYFHLITPVSLLANMLIVPLSGFALMSNLGSLLCGTWFASAGELFNHSAWFWMQSMIYFSEWMAGLPKAFAYVRSPSLVETMLYYVSLGIILSGSLSTSLGKKLLVVCVVAMATLFIGNSQVFNKTVRLSILPIPGGTIFIDAPGQVDDLLIDCGSASSAEFAVKPFLQAQGVNRIAQLLITHVDVKHAGGFDLLRAAFPIGQVATSAARFRSPAYGRMTTHLGQAPEYWQRIARGSSIGVWNVLHPDRADRFTRGGDASIALRGELHGFKVLLLSDLSRFGQQQLWQRENDLRADIVISGIPSDGESLIEDLLEAIQPKLIVIACAEYPASANASRKLRARLANLKTPVIYCNEAGTVTLTFDPTGWKLATMNPQRTPQTSGFDAAGEEIADPDL